MGEKTSCERRYFISSLDGTDARTTARAVRDHWQIENSLHWVLDVGFAEDQSRVRTGRAAENLSRLRRIALNLLKAEIGRHGENCSISLKFEILLRFSYLFLNLSSHFLKDESGNLHGRMFITTQPDNLV